MAGDRPAQRDGSTARSPTTAERGKAGLPGVDAANPRANNVMGQIIRWKEDGDFDATTLALEPPRAGRRPGQRAAAGRGQHQGRHLRLPRRASPSTRAACCGSRPTCSASVLNKGEFAALRQQPDAGLRRAHRRDAALPDRPGQLRDHRRRMDARRPHDVRQHPASGRNARASAATRPIRAKFSNWPDFQPGGRPRSATVVIRKRDGGVIGT